MALGEGSRVQALGVRDEGLDGLAAARAGVLAPSSQFHARPPSAIGSAVPGCTLRSGAPRVPVPIRALGAAARYVGAPVSISPQSRSTEIASQSVSFQVANGVSLKGDAWGDPAHAPALLLHGGGQTRHAWAGTAIALARRGWYAVAVDQRGHGESDWAPTETTPARPSPTT